MSRIGLVLSTTIRTNSVILSGAKNLVVLPVLRSAGRQSRKRLDHPKPTEDWKPLGRRSFAPLRMTRVESTEPESTKLSHHPAPALPRLAQGQVGGAEEDHRAAQPGQHAGQIGFPTGKALPGRPVSRTVSRGPSFLINCAPAGAAHAKASSRRAASKMGRTGCLARAFIGLPS